MEKSRVSYQIEHNGEDFFFPLTVKTLYDETVVFTDFANTIEETCKVIQSREASLDGKFLEDNNEENLEENDREM